MKYLCIIALMLFAAGAYASGGAYLDDFQIANNGLTIFSDNFDDGKLDGWVKVHDMEVTCDKPGKPPCGVFLNKHDMVAASGYRNLNLNNGGLIELQMKVYLTTPEEQYDYQHHGSCCIQTTLYSTNGATMRVTVSAVKGQQQAKLCVTQDKIGNGTCQRYYPLPKDTWADVALVMDPKTRMATALLNDKPQVSTSYDPSLWRSVREVGIRASYGDGCKRTD